MKKFIVWLVLGIVLGSTAFGITWFIGNTSVKQETDIEVVTPVDMACTVKSTFGDGKLTPIHGNAVTFLDKDGNATTAYYGEILTLTFDGEHKVKFDGFTCDAELGKALRVSIDNKLFAKTGYTTGLKINEMPILVSTSNDLGTYTDSAEINVKIFLEGEDAACIRDNMTDSLHVVLNFSYE